MLLLVDEWVVFGVFVFVVDFVFGYVGVFVVVLYDYEYVDCGEIEFDGDCGLE